MIFLGVGGNLPCETFGQPRATCGAALQILETRGIRITARGRWYESAPVPASDQPWYVNGVVAVKTGLDGQHFADQRCRIENACSGKVPLSSAFMP